MEKDFCNKCGECCKHIAVDFERKILFFFVLQGLTDNFAKMLKSVEKKDNITYCCCTYLRNGKCTAEHKPEICQNYPSSPFAYIPENCGFSGDIFIKLEHEKQKIRKLKEDILHYEALIKTTYDSSEIKQYEKIIKHHTGLIDRYKFYGSYDW